MREEQASSQLGELKAAFKGDVEALAAHAETMRTEAAQANMFARSATRTGQRRSAWVSVFSNAK